jgi:hypothetical protein
MNESIVHLNSFIGGFNLRKPNGVISFNAKIDFITGGTIKTKDSEVHIITSDNLASIYFINPSINKDGLPDMFDAKNTNLIYINNQYLNIESGAYSISIFPLTSVV